MSENGLFAYLFVIDSTQLPLPEALKVVDKLSEVENWQTILPDAAVVVSHLTVGQLQEVFKAHFVDQRYILILLEKGKKAGWLAKRSWKFMNEPASLLDSRVPALDDDL